MIHQIYIGIGSNIGDKAAYVEKCLVELSALPDTKIDSLSSVYETVPYGVKEQGNFYNLAARVVTGLDVPDLLRELKEIEKRVGRNPRARWHEREIDLDILLYDDLVIDSAEIKIPHPGIEKRDFVLIPLAEIDPELVNPATGKMLSRIEIPDKEKCVINKLNLHFNYK